MFSAYLSIQLAQVLPVMVVVLVPVYSTPCRLILQSENDNAVIESMYWWKWSQVSWTIHLLSRNGVNDYQFHEQVISFPEMV